MKNDRHITKEKIPSLVNLHMVLIYIKLMMLIGLHLVLVWTVVKSGTGVFLAVTVFFLLIRSLVRLTFRLIVTVVYIILLIVILREAEL